MAYRRPLPAVALLVLASGFAAACGGSESDSTSPTPGPKLADVPAKLAASLCKVTSQCLGPLYEVFLQGQDCTEKQLEDLQEGDFSLVSAAVDAGRVTYDGSKVDACLAAIETAGCDVVSQRLATVCDGVLSGKAAAGADCTLNAECVPGLFCKSDAACPGACTALLNAGKACTKSDECKDGLVCSNDSGTCIEPSPKDGSCGGTSGKECAFDAMCVGGSATATGACKPVDSVFSGTEGGACDVTNTVYCQEGLSCALTAVDASNKAVWKCEKPSTTGTCHVGYPETCPEGQYCELPTANVDGACKPLPADGQACAGHVPSSADDKKDLCAVGTVCAGTTCKAIQHLGAACGSDAECLSKLCKGGKCLAAPCAD